MRIACSTSAFKTTLDDALTQVARLGFSCVDLIAIPGWGHVQPAALAENFDAEAARVELLLKKRELRPVGMNLAVDQLHSRNDAETNRRRLREVEGACRLMKRLGIAVASFYPGYRAEGRPWDHVLADEVATIREMLAVAAPFGVTLAVELHAMTPFETVEQGTALLAALPELRVAYDPSHYAMQEIPLQRTEPFLDRTVHVHARDAGPGQMQMALGEGTVDFAWLADALRRRGYEGCWSIEYLPGLEGADVSQQIRKTRKKLESLAV
jgi:sugar phosphate isomerase/epimerase